MKNALHPTWRHWLDPYLESPVFQNLQKKLHEASKAIVFPPSEHRYAALAMDPEQIKVVILGQDPYHGPGQAMGLAFSVPKGIKNPPSLVNIYKEIEAEGGKPAKGRDGDLTPWAKQGVLLLNTALSVESGEAGSHRGWGWEDFTNGIIGELSKRRENLVFLLWGSHAQEKEDIIDPHRGHLVLKAPHPSPLSAHRGFFGCGHFKKTNDFLISKNQYPIEW